MKTLIKFLIINAFILMVYIFSGCEQITDPVDNSATDNNTLNKAYQTRPFVAEVVATFLTQVNDSVTVYFGTGHATHWGRFTVMDTVTHHINQTSYTVDGNDWITVANGDLVHMTWFADYYDPTTWVWDIVGGTGRFAGATGAGTWEGEFLPSGDLWVRYTGTITY